MTPQEIIETLRANVGKRVVITFDDGVVQSVNVNSVDQEGFVHSGPDGEGPEHFWTRFTSVAFVGDKDSN